MSLRKTMESRAHREARFAYWRSEGFSVNTSRLTVGVSASTGAVYESRRLARLMAGSDAWRVS
jgi:hypothetical protein